jgi:hypothetical protein
VSTKKLACAELDFRAADARGWTQIFSGMKDEDGMMDKLSQGLIFIPHPSALILAFYLRP